MNTQLTIEAEAMELQDLICNVVFHRVQLSELEPALVLKAITYSWSPKVFFGDGFRKEIVRYITRVTWSLAYFEATVIHAYKLAPNKSYVLSLLSKEERSNMDKLLDSYNQGSLKLRELLQLTPEVVKDHKIALCAYSVHQLVQVLQQHFGRVSPELQALAKDLKKYRSIEVRFEKPVSGGGY